MDDAFHIYFAPDHWNNLNKFEKFCGAPFPDNRKVKYYVKSCDDHLQKFIVLSNLLNRLAPDLESDIKEIEETGYTPAIRHKEYAALCEVLICELYAALDCLRYTVFYIYKDQKTDVQKKSTEKFFKKAVKDQYGEEFPDKLKESLSESYSRWFGELRTLRTEIAHGGLGSCHTDNKTGKIFYMHPGLGSQSKAHVIKDIVGKLNFFHKNTVLLIDKFFEFFLSVLEPNDREIMCGIYKGRVYMRRVSYSLNLSFSDGICIAKSWFDKDENLTCPLKDRCGAYERTL
ncbi:MAG: hypothetical protein SCARUB_00710 [Candidatus Scalindua rubra]|uniref:Uncharacterized protein n=1 Tax=Candidatus Scalindua rubra TaxID=1872076 RepID=A0A1E3XEX8_9BACT|nr:MAG: hypothetical protein SCARUB_00710 [Candidatus Scalindua rubra]